VAQLFPTPPELAARVVEMAEIRPGDRVLEPSAGIGASLAPIDPETAGAIVAVESHSGLAAALRDKMPWVDVYFLDFLGIGVDGGHSLGRKGLFDRIVMNPPFANGQDIAHVTHALGMLKPDGVLVAIMSAGTRFRQDRKARQFRALMEQRGAEWHDLPPDSFADAGTGVNTCIVKVAP
jgi:protein-L-isoaspartate O-methyltransferase